MKSPQKKLVEVINCKNCNTRISTLWKTCPGCHQTKVKSNSTQASQSFLQKGLNKLAQNNIISFNGNTFHLNIQKDMWKYGILFIVFGVFLYFLMGDLWRLKQEEINKAIIDINVCSDKFKLNSCHILLNTPHAEESWRRGCAQWQVCMEQDPNDKIRVIQLLSTYLAGVMNLSLQTFNSQIIGLILMVYFAIKSFSHLLDSFCPKRK